MGGVDIDSYIFQEYFCVNELDWNSISAVDFLISKRQRLGMRNVEIEHGIIRLKISTKKNLGKVAKNMNDFFKDCQS